MKKIFILTFVFVSYSSSSQELNLSFFEKLNEFTISSVKEMLVEGYGFSEVSENKYLHPKSTNETNALLITISESEFDNKTRIARQMEVICSDNFNINTFKSELLEQGYVYQGKSKDPSIDLKHYKKGVDKEVAIFVISKNDIKKFQIFFITRY